MAGMGLMGNGVFLMVLRYLAQILKSAQKRSLKLLVADVCVCVCVGLIISCKYKHPKLHRDPAHTSGAHTGNH